MGPKVTKQYITILPNKNYANLSGIRASSLKENEIIQYGYIKIRDLQKWNNDEVVSVKMGQLTPSAYSYIGMSVVNAACNRIEQQDTTALFDDEDELIPVYVFVSTLTDIEWRGYLRCHGYCSSRKNVQREGIRISKSQLITEYEKKFNCVNAECSIVENIIEDTDVNLDSSNNLSGSAYTIFGIVFQILICIGIYFIADKYEDLEWIGLILAITLIPPIIYLHFLIALLWGNIFEAIFANQKSKSNKEQEIEEIEKEVLTPLWGGTRGPGRWS